MLTDKAESSFLRDVVAVELKEIGDVATPKLSDILLDEHYDMQARIAAARILGSGLRRGPMALIQLCAMKSTDWRLRRIALDLLF